MQQIIALQAKNAPSTPAKEEDQMQESQKEIISQAMALEE